MRGIVGIVVGLSALAALPLGCGPGKQLPDTSLKSNSSAPVDPVPAKSEVEAKRIVDHALKATSGDQVSRIEKVKAFKSTAKGLMIRPINQQNVTLETTREFHAAWPDRCRLRLEAQTLKPFTVGMRRPTVWWREGEQLLPIADPKLAERIAVTDSLGLDWMLLLTPLIDAKTIVFGATSDKVGDKKYDMVKASVPGYPLFYLTFDPAGYLTRIEFSNEEGGGVAIRKILVATEHKPFGGLMLPTKIDYSHNGEVVARWATVTWEILDTIDDRIFDAPK